MNESDVQDLEPNMNKDQWTDVISRNWDPSLFKTTEIKDGDLFSSDDEVRAGDDGSKRRSIWIG